MSRHVFSGLVALAAAAVLCLVLAGIAVASGEVGPSVGTVPSPAPGPHVQVGGHRG